MSAQNLSKSESAAVEPLRVDIPEAARILGVSRSRIYLRIKDGSLSTVKEGGRTLLTMVELRSYVARMSAAAAESADASRSAG